VRKPWDGLEEVLFIRATEGQARTKTVTKTFADGTVETTVTEEQHISDVVAMFLLKRWRPEYRESYRVEGSAPGGGPLQTGANLDAAVEHFRAEVLRLAGEDGASEAA
jgi:hypothetical protein